MNDTRRCRSTCLVGSSVDGGFQAFSKSTLTSEQRTPIVHYIYDFADGTTQPHRRGLTTGSTLLARNQAVSIVHITRPGESPRTVTRRKCFGLKAVRLTSPPSVHLTDMSGVCVSRVPTIRRTGWKCVDWF